MNIKSIIDELDRLNVSGNELEGVSFLEKKLEEAEASGDTHSELSILSELLGQYRRCGMKDKGLETCARTIALVNSMNMVGTASGATVLVNTATTLKAFGKAKESIPIFKACEQTYLKRLAVNDYRISALYNNMALSCEDINEYDEAEECFKKAIAFLEDKDNTECDRAVSFCSLAELYDHTGRGEEAVNDCMEHAWELFSAAKRDGYLSFSIGKCLQAFDYYGFFLYASQLRKIRDEIDELLR